MNNNYEFISEKYIDEIESDVKIYKHKKSGARICIMPNDDENKVFSIAFRTPPINNCGLTHILEHSVLCGSKKYPVKDPFVELLKSSLNTFLNAFTFPDKTMYPLASLNDKDFKNLMGVYMDAVFYPNIYKNEEIFNQEGWHYHLTDKNDPITYNGVVYNEMRGAFSNPEDTLNRIIMHSLFPDNAYGLESGGDPLYIPDLDYNEFLDFHKKYYSPSNSYIYVYGNCDMDERLDWLDKEYLSKFDKVDFDTTLKPQKAFDKANIEIGYYETTGELNNKTFLSYNVAFGKALDIKKQTAATLLVNALFNIPGAPLKEAIQKSGIGTDVSASYENGILNPYLSIVVTGANEADFDKLKDIIDSNLKEYANGGLDKSTILSLINHTEFENREKSFSSRFPKGIMIAISALNTWLYDENAPFEGLEQIEIFKNLKNDLETGYFEKMINEDILNNPHKSYVKLIPTLDSQKKQDEEIALKLKAYKESLSDKEIDELILKNQKLEEYQNEPSSAEDIAKLPKLSLEDIDRNPNKYNIEERNANYKLLYSNYHTNEITYLRYYFDISHINPNDLLVTALYLDLLKQMSTDKYSYFEINNIIRNELGSLGYDILNIVNVDYENKLYIGFNISCLDEKTKLASDLLFDIIMKTDFSDTKRIYQKLGEFKSSLEMSISGRGHAVAIARALSNIDEQNLNKDTTGGIAYLDFISNLYKNFDNEKEYLVNALENVKNSFAKNNLIVDICGNENTFNNAKIVADSFYNSLNDKAIYNKYKFIPCPKSEAIIAPFNVNFVSRVGRYNGTYTGASMVLENAVSMDYLWQNVRVHGGAYGCFMNVGTQGLIGFTSYRDPHIDRTYKAYSEALDYVKSFKPEALDLLNFKIGAIGNAQVVEHVKVKSQTALSLYLRGISYEYRKNRREELLNASNDDFAKMVSWYSDALANSSICVIGNKDAIEKSELKFDEVRNLTD